MVLSVFAFAQSDTLLKPYYLYAKFDEECAAQVAVTLFDKDAKLDLINQVILNELMRGFYDNQSWVSLKNLYGNKSLKPNSEFQYTIAASCSFHYDDLFSFSACAYNVCDKNIYSTFESNCVNIDLKTQQILSLYDFIDPLKKDSFEKYIYATATRYHIKNIPACYISSYNPLQIKGACSVTVQADSITYYKGLTNKFYLKDNSLFVFNKVKHRTYTYQSVEVSLKLIYIKYFLRPEMILRLGIQ